LQIRVYLSSCARARNACGAAAPGELILHRHKGTNYFRTNYFRKQLAPRNNAARAHKLSAPIDNAVENFGGRITVVIAAR
jgi:hypothetical protein